MSKPEVRILRENGELWGLDIMTGATVTPDIVVATKPIDPGSSGGGTVIVDSVIETGRGISIRGIQSAFPVAGAQTLMAFDRERATQTFFRSIVGELVTVIIPRHPAFEDCLLAGYPWEIDGKLRTPFAVAFRQNKIASSTTVILPRIAPRAPDIEPPDDIGEQPTTPVTAPRQVVDESIGVQLGKRAGFLN